MGGGVGGRHLGENWILALRTQSGYWSRVEADSEAHEDFCLEYPPDRIGCQEVTNDFPMHEGMSSTWEVVDRFSEFAVFMVVPHTRVAKTTKDSIYREVGVLSDLPADGVGKGEPEWERAYTYLFGLLRGRLNFFTTTHRIDED